MRCKLSLIIILLAGLFNWPICAAFGHAIGADASVEADGRTVTIEAWLTGGKIPKQGLVIVLDEAGQEVLRGNLNNGFFQFQVPSRQRYRFQVQLGEGHAKSFVLEEKEYARLQDPGSIASATGVIRSSSPIAGAIKHSDNLPGMRILAGFAMIGILCVLGWAVSRVKRSLMAKDASIKSARDTHGAA